MADRKKTEKVKEKTTARVETKTVKVETPKVAPKITQTPKITNVYNPNFSVIDNTIEEIKKQVNESEEKRNWRRGPNSWYDLRNLKKMKLKAKEKLMKVKENLNEQ